MKILITGDSHTSALKLGADRLISQGGLPYGYQVDLKPIGTGGTFTAQFFLDKGDFVEMKNQRNPNLVKRLPVATEEGNYDYYGITGMLHTHRVWRYNNYWTKFTPFCTASDLAPVSTSLLRHIVLNDQQYPLQMIDVLKRAGVKVFVIETPKPYKHHPILEQVDKEVITYIDTFYKSVIKEWLASNGIPVVNIPANCYDADSFMLEAFRNENPKDSHHANLAFGEVMIKEILAFLKSQN
ncbi:MAG: hypothetical protein CTY16_18160 [Methylobacter sp.]|nr:MAG: hypothetical protein CTY16_18160 [Methylobacter sp.]